MVLTTNTKVIKTDKSRISEVDFDNIPFGRVFSDHMLIMEYKDGAWDQGTIRPFEKLRMSPASMVLHYGQAIFEGMKAEKGQDGEIYLFRPELNIQRLNKSAVRMAMPEIPEQVFLDKLRELIAIDKDWVPTKEGYSLYLRPFMIASDEFIGVKPSQTYKFIIFTCPSGPYYSKPVNVYIETKYSRAAAGGTGFAKAAGNYAASLRPAQIAGPKGFDQILWTDSVEHKYVQEIGTMNVFFVFGETIVTPELNDCILPGTTRQTLIEMMKAEGLKVEERPITTDEIFEAHEKGILNDCFGCGTAAVIIPIASIGNDEKTVQLPPVEKRTISAKFKKQLVDIKRGLAEDKFNWLVKV